jgi:hypothetical protein
MEPEIDQATKAELERLELLLMDAAVRQDRAQVGALLSSEFVEFGSSGRVWTREATMELLATEKTYAPPHVEGLTFRLLGPGVVLATYQTSREDVAGGQVVTLRSSIWVWETGSWKICFHQGTRAGGADQT